VFRTYSKVSSNEFIGNIAGEGHLSLNNQGNGASLIDFDKATSTGKLMLFKPSSEAQKITILLGECLPDSAGNLTEGGATIDVICKHNAKSSGTFHGVLNFSGHSLEALRRIARVGANVTFTKMKLTLSEGIASFYSSNGKITLNDCFIDIKEGQLFFIETHTSFTDPILELKGHNTILHAIPETNLVAKFITANPSNVSYKQFTAGGLKTNAILNTIIEGNTDTEATLITETTNTY
jgi:hypothetical protein